MSRVVITSRAFNPAEAAESFRRKAANIGAIVSFAGYVRGEDGSVNTLRLTHYPGLTESEIDRIVKTAMTRWDVVDCFVIHRVGDMSPGEAIVFVTAASAHRREAFEAVDFIMDYLKSEAPFWKQEIGRGETKWIEPRAQDKDDIKRWDMK